uniref:Embryo sac development arrest 6 n=1 Tax=Ananas comosus var. bracteatus TaxID=296719 RepID=A0A6V7PZS4_ANACO|nr:unnamed protein product [Ananas comosus var. bracteatus]
MSSYTRREGTLGAWRKRKEQREPCDPPRTKPVAADAEPDSSSGSGSDGNNKVLAGYLAHEFLTRGTLFGKRFEPGKKDPNPNPNPVRPAAGEPPRAYAEVSYILRADGGAHVAGVVNPTQLARWIRIGGEDNAAKHQNK